MGVHRLDLNFHCEPFLLWSRLQQSVSLTWRGKNQRDVNSSLTSKMSVGP
ncbi:hypothetical protein RSSM_06024 [Rhodopirellula sallentina SM41]|uniref:Uncharacterized protein n=1 Tax=Rhodopirellula sallentina SM41 TaxID=1263870 RepID=M5TU01_9BACT|nr:hypothetical protein RSSM_06024 [Rhodopirellula sallentina SM41]